MVSPANPLRRASPEAPVATYFGKGIVETENDFGLLGQKPTHRKCRLVATEFVASGWSQKAVHRVIVTSATYRQSSRHRPEIEEADPYNRLLAQQARMRLEAEIIRDAALAASGLLTPKVGGPSVYPPIPPGAMAVTQVKREWPTATGPDRYRRGILHILLPHAPHPAWLIRRPRATSRVHAVVPLNSPLQALTLLNDEAFIEFARALAKRVLKESPSNDRRPATMLSHSPWL